MEFSRFISSCRNPKPMLNKHGHRIIVSCGRCPDCINKKHVRYRDLVEKEMSTYKYNHFITLTYDELCVPTARIYEDFIDDNTINVRYVDVTKRPKIGKLRRTLPTYNKTIATFPLFNNDESYEIQLFNEFHSNFFQISIKS